MDDLGTLERRLTDLEAELFPDWVALARCEATLAVLAQGETGLRLLDRGDWHPRRRMGRLRGRWSGFESVEAAAWDLAAVVVVVERFGDVAPAVLGRWRQRCADGWGAQAAVGLGVDGQSLETSVRELGRELWRSPAWCLRWEGWVDDVCDSPATALTRWVGRVGCTYAARSPHVAVVSVPAAVAHPLGRLHTGLSVWGPDADVGVLLGVRP